MSSPEKKRRFRLPPVQATPKNTPIHYSTPQEMSPWMDKYFADCDKSMRPYTLPGLTLALGFCSTSSLYSYQKKDGFNRIMSQARLRIQTQRVENLVEGIGSTVGVKFDLVNEFDYVDKRETTVIREIGVESLTDEQLTVRIQELHAKRVIEGDVEDALLLEDDAWLE